MHELLSFASDLTLLYANVHHKLALAKSSWHNNYVLKSLSRNLDQPSLLNKNVFSAT
jgi:hypothetical protein